MHSVNKIIPVVAGIIKKQNYILTALRPEGKPYSGFWEFPGGKIESNETSLTALERELNEELGIRVTEAELLFQHMHQYPDKKVILDIWLVQSYLGEPDGKEGQKLYWSTITELQELKVLEGNKSIILELKRLFEN